MIITKEHQESWVNAYVKEKHTTDECIGFIDGIEKALNFVQEKMKPTQKQKLEEYIWSKIFPNEKQNSYEIYIKMHVCPHFGNTMLVVSAFVKQVNY